MSSINSFAKPITDFVAQKQREEVILNRLTWQRKSIVSVGTYEIPCAERLMEQTNQKVGIRYDSQAKRVIKSLLWPLFSLRNDLFTDGFIESNIGKWIRELVRADTTFLEIGCGDMSLHKYLVRVPLPAGYAEGREYKCCSGIGHGHSHMVRVGESYRINRDV